MPETVDVSKIQLKSFPAAPFLLQVQTLQTVVYYFRHPFHLFGGLESHIWIEVTKKI